MTPLLARRLAAIRSRAEDYRCWSPRRGRTDLAAVTAAMRLAPVTRAAVISVPYYGLGDLWRHDEPVEHHPRSDPAIVAADLAGRLDDE